MGEEVLHRAIFAEELLCPLLPDALTAGDIVHLVPQEGEVVDDLAGGTEAELLRDLSFAPRLVATTLHRAVHTYLVGDQLTIILIGSDHQHLTPCARG